MRAAAVALVLIVGAAVVLWFGNTLNSWVLGGLVGGLAAILLSIPISLLVFLSIARRHEEKLQDKERELAFLAQEYMYEDEYSVVDDEAYDYDVEAEARVLPQENLRGEYERHAPMTSQLPPADYPRLPAAGQSHASPRTTNVLRQTNVLKQQQPKTTVALRNKNNPTRNLAGQSQRKPQTNIASARNPHLTAALHKARQEALEEQQNTIEVVPHTTSYSKRPAPTTRSLYNQSGRRTTDQNVQPRRAKSGRPSSDRADWSEDAVYDTEMPYGYDEEDEEFFEPRQTDSLRARQGLYSTTEHGRTHSPQTGSMRRTPSGQVDQASRRNQTNDSRRYTDAPSGSLKNPLVRRAPYLYEDDPLRQELARQIDENPMVRRSTRGREAYDEYDDDL